MKKENMEKQPGAFQSAFAWCASTLPSAVATGLVAIILGIAIIYSLHPYLAVLGLILLSSLLAKVSGMAAEGSLQKTAAAAFAVAVFLIMFAVPSGELGASKCPGRTIPGNGSAAVVKYFESPFCSTCVIFSNNVADAQKQAGFTLQYYDSRYCKAQMAQYGFQGTPCYVFAGPKGTTKACGLMTADEIVQKVGGIS